MFLYNLVIHLYGFIIRLASINNPKARKWIQGRKNWKENLRTNISELGPGKRVWIHCASYGEFEQGRPLTEAIRARHPEHKIILTFFSPSGYESFKDWAGADVICYLPLDTRANAKHFIKIVSPQTVIFIKYEFWVNFLFELKRQNIPTFLVSAVFKKHHPFFKWFGGLFRRSLQTFTKMFIQDDYSGKLLQEINMKNYEVAGDTRFDRVLEVKENFRSNNYFEQLGKEKKNIIVGSSWLADEELMIEAFKKINSEELRLVFVPHQIDEKNINELKRLLEKNELGYQLYSSGIIDASKPVLIVDAMGLLANLYHYAAVAYIGGGFNSGIHNCLEPAAHLKPMVFYGGDDYHKYNEAIDLMNLKVAKNIFDSDSLASALKNFLFSVEPSQVENKLREYFDRNSGTTEKIFSVINW